MRRGSAHLRIMIDDLSVIVKRFPSSWPKLNLYALGDCHVGSEQFNETALKKKIQIIRDDPYGVVTLCGDLGDFGLRTSVTNPLRAKLQPAEQMEAIYHLFEPIADKIVSAVPGNHEQRLTKESGIDPLLTLCCRWHCEDVYRENVAILKLQFGQRSNKDKQMVFIGITTHGSSIRKHQRFISAFQPIDWSVAGHSHTPMYYPHGVVFIDAKHATAKHVGYKEIVVDANMTPGGYAIKYEYEIAPPPELQYLEMYCARDTDRNRTMHKIMNYHSIQI